MIFEGYREAFNIMDKQIYPLIERHPITKDNALKWLNFCRTLSINLSIFEESAKEVIITDQKK